MCDLRFTSRYTQYITQSLETETEQKLDNVYLIILTTSFINVMLAIWKQASHLHVVHMFNILVFGSNRLVHHKLSKNSGKQNYWITYTKRDK